MTSRLGGLLGAFLRRCRGRGSAVRAAWHIGLGNVTPSRHRHRPAPRDARPS